MSLGDGSIVVDLFAGGGGASIGIEAALGRPIDVAIDHDPVALAVHRANHPATRHLEADVWEVRPREATGGRPVGLLWASPDCTHFSVAKGGVPRKQSIRTLAWVVTRWAAEVSPRVICLENVREFQGWGPLGPDGRPDRARMGSTFRAWRRRLERLGYVVDYRVIDASTLGAPTNRRRLYLVARRDGLPVSWPEPTHGFGLKPLRTAAECIDWSIPCPSIFARRRPLAEKTLWRIARGIQRFVIDNPRPFLLRRSGAGLVAMSMIQTGYGERPGQRARALDIRSPLGTCVDGQKHGLVGAFLAKHFGDPGRVGGGGRVLGQRLDAGLGVVTARDHHSLATVDLAPAAGRLHRAEVRAFLSRYNGVGEGQRLDTPLGTVTSRDRFAVVVVDGDEYEIADIGMRMLQPEELLRAQFGRFAKSYDLSAARTKTAKVRLIGNSVCPEVAHVIVGANIATAS